MAKILTTGVPHGIPQGINDAPRLEISDFIKDEKQFSLYIQALNKMMYGIPHTDTGSYFSLAAIHGYPLIDWNQAPCENKMYCVHRTEHFLPWHRPYVAAFEQEIHKHAVAIAATYTTDDRLDWEKAAANIRQPYWGWDELSTFVLPDKIILDEEVEITFPDGHKDNVRNPLFSYTFPEGTTDTFPSPYNTMKKTMRYYNENTGDSQPEELKKALSTSAERIVGDVRNLLSVTTWYEFSVTGTTTNSLEDVHGAVHVLVGSREHGHMRKEEVSGFEPIFWLHHAQVDRLTDMWYQRHKLWPTDHEELVPFWTSQTDYWLSTMTTKLSDFNYSYDPAHSGRPIMAVAAVNRNGRKHAARLLPLDSKAPKPDTLLSLVSSAGIGLMSMPFAATEAASAITIDIPDEEVTLKDWFVRIRCKQFEIGGSFVVFAFLAGVPPNPADWEQHPGFAGAYEVFANSNPGSCANCKKKSDGYVCGFVHLNYTLLSHLNPEFASLDDEVVMPFLKSKLSWAVIKDGGERVDLKKIPSLEVTLGHCPVSLSVGNDLQHRGKAKIFEGVTLDWSVPGPM